MGNLGAYLRPIPAGKTKEIFLENFKDEKGNKIPFVVMLESDRNSHPKTSRINQSESDRNSQS